MSKMTRLRDRSVGSFVGLAVGDALGTTLQFQPRNHGPLHTEMIGGGFLQLQPGQWTDDTAMALALAESLIDRMNFDPADVISRFVRWYKEGEYSCTGRCTDIGRITRLALDRYLKDGEPFAGSTSTVSAGNGSLMRLSPAAIFAGRDHSLRRAIAQDQSRLTHGATEAIEACQFAALLIYELIDSGQSERLTRSRIWEGRSERVRQITRGSSTLHRRGDVRATGYVIDTLEAALWAVSTTASFEDALITAVNLGGDADTVGAVTGQIAGALYGASAIPDRWLEPLAWRVRIEAAANNLFRLGFSEE